jgi:hypothetical protein
MADPADMILRLQRELRAAKAALHEETRTLVGGPGGRLLAMAAGRGSHGRAAAARETEDAT